MANYWTNETNEAIVKYCNLDDKLQRDLLFEQSILPSFKKMVENNINIRQLQYNDKDELINDSLTFLCQTMPKYNPNNGDGFGYFNWCLKNYLIQESKKYVNKINHEVSCNAINDEDNNNDDIINKLEPIATNEDNKNDIAKEYKSYKKIIQEYIRLYKSLSPDEQSKIKYTNTLFLLEKIINGQITFPQKNKYDGIRKYMRKVGITDKCHVYSYDNNNNNKESNIYVYWRKIFNKIKAGKIKKKKVIRICPKCGKTIINEVKNPKSFLNENKDIPCRLCYDKMINDRKKINNDPALFQRICPVCGKNIIYKSKYVCAESKENNTPCRMCYRLQCKCNIGKSNLTPDKLPNKQKQHKKNYYYKNKEKVLNQVKQYRLKNKEKILQYQKDYYNKHKEKMLEYHKQYRKEKNEYNNL